MVFISLNIKNCVLFGLRDIKKVNNVYILKGTRPNLIIIIVEHEKDLSVYFSKNLNFAYDCNYVYTNASRRLSLMLRSFINLDFVFL